MPTQALILALVAIIVVPGIAFAGVLLSRYAAAEKSRYELEAKDVARAAAAVIDRDLTGLINTLQVLSTSRALAAGNLEDFYRQASSVKAFIGADIGLRLPNGQQLVNTRVPWGTSLPATPLETDARAIATRGPVISDVFVGSIANRPLVAVIVPVIVDDEAKYLLHVGAETERVLNIIKPVIPADWLIGIGDRNGTYVTRSENHAEFTGKPGVPAFLARARGDEGSFVGESAFREKVLVGYVRTSLTQWLIAANIRQSLLERPLNDALLLLVGFGVLVLAIAALLALWLWRFIARPLEALEAASRRFGQRETSFDIPTRLREFMAVRDALKAATAEVNQSRDVLELRVAERTQELAQANTELLAQMRAREAAEGQIRQMQKMEAVGQLTGGIAHDFNNMLSIITASLDLLRRRLERGDMNIYKYLDAAEEGANRAASLTRRLLAFSRQQPLAPEVVEMNRLVAGMSELLQRTIGESIRIETVLAAGLWRTRADASEIEDAMPEGGRLTIETSNAFIDDSYVSGNDSVASGQYVMIAVTDTGTGMAEEVIGRAFDPFFTTKKIGMGTGLGLSQVYGFVKQSSGHIKIYSEAGQGTTVKIYLPRYYGETDGDAKPIRKEARPLLAGSQDEVILVVEDEERLRQITVATLEELGYSVLEAGNARDALELLAKRQDIRLLFTDIVMPDVSGRKLADQALALRPDLIVLFTTGFTRNAVVHNGVLDAGVNFLPKPFSMEELAEKIRKVLSH